MEAVLQQIKEFADKAHNEQKRRYSADRYIVHPERVMNIVRKYNDDISVLAAALLHDVLEDTETTIEEMYAFLLTVLDPPQAAKTVKLVEDLTDVYTKKGFPQWNRRKRKSKEIERLEKTNAEAHTIKYADIIDNVPEIINEDPDFAERYVKECREILRKMTKGNQELREVALDVTRKFAKHLQ
ncbi:MAG TPA: HD domain-containing protein [Chitinophagaceae bacterium]